MGVLSRPLSILILAFSAGYAPLSEAATVPGAEKEPASAIMSLFSPFLRENIHDLGDSVSIGTIEQRIETLEEERRQLPSGDKRSFRIAEVVDEISVLRSLRDSIREVEGLSLEEVPMWIDALNDKANDLQRIRAGSRMYDELTALVGYSLLAKDAAISAKLVAAINHLLAKLGKDPLSLISKVGNSWEGVDFVSDTDPRRRNYEARDATLLFALRYALASDAADAVRTRDMLLRFGEVMPAWSVFTREGQEFPRKEKSMEAFVAAGGDNGLWGTWYPLELRACFPLVQAFALTRDAMSPENQQKIMETVFVPFEELLAYFPFDTHHNLLVFHIEGLLLWGLALDDPKLVHRGVQWYDEHLQRGFFPDGYWKELTPDYHQQVIMPLSYRLTELLRNYTDPAGYKDAKTGERFDRVNLRERSLTALRRSFNAWADTLLPDNMSAALTDAEANVPQSFVLASESSDSRLLGASGLAVLASGQGDRRSELYLLYKGTHGHHQEDALSILWYAHGLEVLSETTYRGPAEAQSLRSWYHRAAAHNTVIVDEEPQFAELKGFRVSEDRRLWPEASGVVNNQGKLLIYDHSIPEAQFVQAESVRAYAPKVSQYERTLVTLPFEGGDACLLDIFQVSGGGQHDYMLHAGLNQPYTADVSREGKAIQGTAYDQIHLQKEYSMDKPVEVLFRHENGVNLLTSILGPVGPGTSLLSGTGPAIRRVGTAPYFILRNKGKDVKSAFIATHTVFKQENPVLKVERKTVTGNPEAIVLEVTSRDRVDVVLYASGDREDMRWNGISFQGKLGYVQYRNGKPVLAHIVEGRSLSDDAKTFDLKCPASLTGSLSRPQGMEENVLELDKAIPGVAADDLVHLDFGDLIRWSYPITEVSGQELTLAYPRGFDSDGKEFQMTRFPGWRGADRMNWTIPRQATWRASEQ